MTTPVPPEAPFQVSIAGHNYAIDTEFKPYLRDAFRHRSIASQRESIDLTNEPGEGTVNTADLWRRGQENWVLAGGQPYFDRKQSNATRFWNSKGITTGLTWQIKLLPKATRVYTATDHTGTESLKVMVVGDSAYVADGNLVKYSQNLTSWTTVTGGPGTKVISFTTNGHTVWISYGTAGVYKTTRGASTMSVFAHVTGVHIGTIGWVGTYLLVSSGPKIYGGGGTYAVVGPGLPATPLFTHPNPTWIWFDFSWGDSEIYMAGFVATGFKMGAGGIYRTTTTTTGLNLLVPSLALPLETGESPWTIFSYLNYQFVGTSLGIRMCRTISAYDPSGNAGDLEAGAIQPNLFQAVTTPVFAITAHGRFVYFAWTKFDTASSGIGRLDLSNFVDELTPAYVSDMMIAGQNTIVSMDYVTWRTTGISTPIVAVTNTGLWTYSKTEFVTEGFVDSGYVTYGIPDAKVALQLSLRAQTDDDGTVKGYVSADKALGKTYTLVGTSSSFIDTVQWPIDQLRGEQFQVRIELEPSTTTPPTTPIVNRWLLKSYPAVVSGTTIIAPITLARTVVEQGVLRPFDPYAELAFLQSKRQSQEIVKYVEGPFTATVIITTLDWIPYGEQGNAGNRRGYNGTLVVYMKTFPSTTTA